MTSAKPVLSMQGYVRSMQMSRMQVFAFVEGWSDRYFYSKVCTAALAPSNILFSVRASRELPNGNEGKKTLLSFHDYLRRRGSLLQDLNGKRTLIVFFLDKDIDDIHRSLRKSRHIIYTPYYVVENHYFAHGDLCEAGAAAAGLTPQQVQAQIPDPAAWRLRAAVAWKEWVKLCIVGGMTRANCACNFSNLSQVNHPGYGGVNVQREQAERAALEKATGLTQQEFGALVARVGRIVEKRYEAGLHDTVFKGKWYARFLAEDLRIIGLANPPFNANISTDGLRQLLMMTLDFAGTWIADFTSPLQQLARLL